MSRARRVAVTSPQTRLALSGRKSVPPGRSSLLLTPDEMRRAERIRRTQLRCASVALVAAAAFLVGVPLLFDLAPALDDVRVAGVPVSWLAVWVLPYPTLAGLAWWQLRRAERTERDGSGTP